MRHDFAVIEDNYVIRVGGFFHIVRGKEHGHSVALAAVVHHFPQRFAGLRVKPGRRLVEYQNLRLVDKRSGYVYSAALAARKFTERAIEIIAETEQFLEFADALFRRFAGNSVKRRAGVEIVFYGKTAVERGRLEHYADLSGDRRHIRVDILAVENYRAGVFRLRSAHNRYRRGLARAVYAQKRKQLAALDRKRQIVHRPQIAERFDEMTYFYDFIQVFLLDCAPRFPVRFFRRTILYSIR